MQKVGMENEKTRNEPETVVIEKPTKVEEAETEVSEETTVVEEVIVDETVTEEPAEELYIPEGIDMESTLSCEEWVASFEGNIAESVVVIYNDNTGRKEVVQENSEVTINPDEDMIAVYWKEMGIGKELKGISIKDSTPSECYEIIKTDSEKMRDIPERPIQITVKEKEADWVINFTIISE